MTTGIRISQNDIDVVEGEDYEMVLTSEVNTLKTAIATEIGPNETYTHDFGYMPIHLFGQYTGDKANFLGFIGQHDPAYEETYGNIVADTTEVRNETNSGSEDIKVFIFYDPLT